MSERAERLSDVARSDVSARGRSRGRSFLLLRLFSRRWIVSTILVLAAMTVMARLGVWQLDRLEQRRAFNARVIAQTGQPLLVLSGEALDADLANMEYRAVVVEGVYDHSQEVALRNQAWGNDIGVHLLTPLIIDGSDRAVLVDRGWVPVEDFTNTDWSQYAEPGKVRVSGMIRASSSRPDWGSRTDPTPSPGEGPLKLWYFANVAQIAEQVSVPLLPVYIQQEPVTNNADLSLPFRALPELDITEGPHMGYALQWFTFATILGVGYLFYVRKKELSMVGREITTQDRLEP